MALRESTLLSRLDDLDGKLAQLRTTASASITTVIDRFRLDMAAARFHLKTGSGRSTLVAIIGGTGTGKSTLVNRLLGADITATSYRRTFTAGAVAVAKSADAIPVHWLGLDPVFPKAQELPVRGQADLLAVVTMDSEITSHITLIDTPDLDGDQPLHHAQADRVFRWAQAVLFLVTPEKYQMTELVPYYRMAARYGLPAIFVMNKAEEQIVVDDYARVVKEYSGAGNSHDIFAIGRDGSAYEPPREMNLEALRHGIVNLKEPAADVRRQGLAARSADLMDRLRDQILQPLRKDRSEVEQMTATLRAMEAPTVGVDVNPLTRQLQRRLQQRSVLYLMGPGRMLDRVRQVPMFLARLPRNTWDLLRHGQVRTGAEDGLPKDWDRSAPNFNTALVDQLAVVQSRIDDLLRSSVRGEKWIEEDQAGFGTSKIEPANAGKIADEEIADLKLWLENRWNATPRDTAILKKLLSVVPGGDKLTKWSEAAPYLLAIVVAAHHAIFGPVDLMVIGGFSLATWLTERISNEVAARTRLANQRINQRFAKLAHEQIEKTCAWLETRAPTSRALGELEEKADRISESLSENG
jgi:50S ribosome-binding GTPase